MKQEVGVEAAHDIEAAEGNGKKELLPYEGRESLGEPQEVNGRIKYFPRYFMKRYPGDTFKLIRVFRKKSGVCRLLAATFKPNHQKRPQDKALYQKLKKAGIPEV